MMAAPGDDEGRQGECQCQRDDFVVVVSLAVSEYFFSFIKKLTIFFIYYRYTTTPHDGGGRTQGQDKKKVQELVGKPFFWGVRYIFYFLLLTTFIH
jgi:hypothetical protein